MKNGSFLFLLAFVLAGGWVRAQAGEGDTLTALRIETPIRLDGLLDEPAWQQAPRISNFRQVEPAEGAPASERTEVAALFTQTALYLGIWCYDSEPAKITAKYLERDFDVDADDILAIALSPFNDRRTGFAFAVNPNGARADGLIEGIERLNLDWNGVWDVAVKRNPQGWFAELYLPFSTLRYREGERQTWGFNIQRHIVRKNEIVRWQNWSRDFQFENLSQTGFLSGLEGIRGKVRLEVKPYGLGGLTQEKDQDLSTTGKLGVDVNKNLLSTLKLNLTVNTDFAQVEVDRIQTNLTRFSLFYPEKREFFLEGASNYSFSLGGPNNLFYSRRIGINEANEQVPILAGVRLFGKAADTNIGVLSIQTREKGEQPSTNYSLLRLRQDVGRQSNVGVLFTSVQQEGYSNLVFGLDAQYTTSTFLKNKNLSMGAMLFGSRTTEVENSRNKGYRLFFDYPNDLLDFYVSTTYLPENFIPGMGFTFRKNYRNYVAFFRFTPRWFNELGVRKMLFQPWRFFLYQDARTGEVVSWEYTLRPLGFLLDSGDQMELNLTWEYDHPDSDFSLGDDILVPAGAYHMNRTELVLESFSGRRLFGELELSFGDYYTGEIRGLGAALGVNVNKHLNLEGEWAFNHLDMPDGQLYSHELSARVLYAFTPRLNLSLFAQWNSEEEFTGFNFRLHWIPKIGSDLYFVFTQAYEGGLRRDYLQETTAALKLVWRVAL